VLSRAVKTGHEQEFEDVLHRLAAQVRRQPGHLDLTVLGPQPGDAPPHPGGAAFPLPIPARGTPVLNSAGLMRLLPEAAPG